MVYLVYGWVGGKGPIMKVMKNNSDDFLTVPNNQYEKFFFNSENDKLSYIWDDWFFTNVTFANYPPSTSGNKNTYILEGTSLNNCKWGIQSWQITNNNRFLEPIGLIGRFFNGPYVPFSDSRYINDDGWSRLVRLSAPQNLSQGAVSFSMVSGDFLAQVSGYTGAPHLMTVNQISTNFNYSGWAIRLGSGSGPASDDLPPDTSRVVTMIWDLPSGPEPMSSPNGGAVTGDVAMDISNTRAVLARKTCKVSSNDQRHMIFDSDWSPVKCVMFGETGNINPGTELFIPNTTDFPLNENMLLDAFFKSDNQGVFQRPPNYAREIGTSANCQVDYKVEPGGIRLRCNGTFGFALRYMLYSAGPDDYTTGGSRVMRELPNGHIQFKRPGSSDVAPNYNDILLDTRIPTVQILDEAWVPLSSFSHGNTHRIPYDDRNGSMFIFPKIITDFGNIRRSGMDFGYLRSVTVSGVQITVKDRSIQSCLTSIQNGYVDATVNTTRAENDGSALNGPTGIRYYILGVPK
ncbi:hypothetical protein [Brucella pseudogrignonensis]|uniref:Uncharacterized protein n=1 Tax=Brucella pseudogrignonensis TaxID=419475 RepID=A0ABU1M4P0_9HYPH|nr:hypothetical protein [Brucella pseudogrignonensis]MDR6430999.1 hypothetical protein [Brucella pseudogrignonensis]